MLIQRIIFSAPKWYPGFIRPCCPFPLHFLCRLISVVFWSFVTSVLNTSYVSKVLQLQMRAVQQRQNEESCRRSAKDKQQKSKVKLFCKKCNKFACSGDYIRCIKEAHHVVIDKDFLSKFSFKRNKCPQSINGVELTGRFLPIGLNLYGMKMTRFGGLAPKEMILHLLRLSNILMFSLTS